MSEKVYEAFNRVLKRRRGAKAVTIDGYSNFLFLNRDGYPKTATNYEDWKPPGKEKKPKPRQKSPEEQFQEAKNRCFRILADYLHLLRAWRTDYAPHSPEEAFHPRFIEALQKQDQVEYLLDVLLFGETEEKAALIMTVCLGGMQRSTTSTMRKLYRK